MAIILILAMAFLTIWSLRKAYGKEIREVTIDYKDGTDESLPGSPHLEEALAPFAGGLADTKPPIITPPPPPATDKPSSGTPDKNPALAVTTDGTSTWKLAIDEAGWVIPPIKGDKTDERFVDAKSGSDANTGSKDRPLKTIQTAFKSKVAGRQLVVTLAPGQVWNEGLSNMPSGNFEDAPTIVRTNPENPSGQRACVTGPPDSNAAYWQSKQNLMLLDLQIRPKDRQNSTSKSIYGIFALNCKNLWVEGCDFALFTNNISYQGTQSGWAEDLVVRRNLITWCYQPNRGVSEASLMKHSEGIYVYKTRGITIRENYFIHNGWNPDKNSHADIYNHAGYLHAINEDVIVEGNYGADNSSHFIQLRPGGSLKYNLSLNNPIAFSVGLVNGLGDQHPGGVTLDVTHNAILGSRDISGQRRGMAFQIGNVKSGTIAQNLIAYGNQAGNTEVAFSIERGNGVAENSQVGVNNLNIERNVVYKWTTGIKIDEALKSTGKGSSALSRLRVVNNYLPQKNQYSTGQAKAMQLDSMKTWTPPADDPKLQKYAESLNLGTNDFSTLVMRQSRWHWDPRLTPKAAVEYLEQQFKMN